MGSKSSEISLLPSIPIIAAIVVFVCWTESENNKKAGYINKLPTLRATQPQPVIRDYYIENRRDEKLPYPGNPHSYIASYKSDKTNWYIQFNVYGSNNDGPQGELAGCVFFIFDKKMTQFSYFNQSYAGSNGAYNSNLVEHFAWDMRDRYSQTDINIIKKEFSQATPTPSTRFQSLVP